MNTPLMLLAAHNPWIQNEKDNHSMVYKLQHLQVF